MIVSVSADMLSQLFITGGAIILLGATSFSWWVVYDSYKRGMYDYTVWGIVFGLFIDGIAIFMLLVSTGTLIIK